MGAERSGKFWAGWVLTVLPALVLIASGVMKLVQPGEFLTNWTKFGYPAPLASKIGIVEISCAILLLIPRTALLGAVLVAAYLGGATATHVRIGDPTFFGPIVLGVLAWLGLWLREPRLRELAPLRK